MKGLVIAVAVATILLLTGLPGAVGYFAEREHDRLTADRAALDDQLVEAHYERGWFASQARYRYRIEDPRLRRLLALLTAEADGTPEIVVDNRLHHGPVPLLAGGDALLAWTDVDSTLVLLTPSGNAITLPGTLRSHVQADGTTRLRYRAPAETRALRDGVQLAWEDIAIDVTVGRRGDRIGIDAASGALELADGSRRLRLGGATVTAQQRLSGSGLWNGEVAVGLNTLALPEFAADAVTLTARLSENAGAADIALRFDAAGLSGDFPGDAARMDLQVQQLGAAALAGLLEAAEAGALPTDRQTALLAGLLRPGPQVNLRALTIPLPDADFEAEAVIAVTPGTGLDQLAGGIEGNATVALPKSLLQQIAADGSAELGNAIELMQQFGLLTADGDRYRIEAAYAGGLLTINGFPLPLPVF